jgi:hypothetical protein
MSDWHIAGSYYESCNCQAICPCRRVDGRPGGRSTYGICQFLLSWQILAGTFDRTGLSGRRVAMAGFYDNDEPGSRWRVVLYVDEDASEAAADALHAIFSGRAAGNMRFTAEIAEVIAVRKAVIDLDHRKGRESISVRDFASAAVERPAGQTGTVTCAIPGHDHPGIESVSRSKVADGSLAWSYEGRCGFATDFEYRSSASVPPPGVSEKTQPS